MSNFNADGISLQLPVSPREVLVFVHIACARNLPPSADGQLCLRVSGAWVEGELLRAAAC